MTVQLATPPAAAVAPGTSSWLGSPDDSIEHRTEPEVTVGWQTIRAIQKVLPAVLPFRSVLEQKCFPTSRYAALISDL